MANTYVKIRQLEPSTSVSSLIYTNGSNTPIYFAPSTGSDKGLFWDDSASSIAWHTYGAGLTMTGTVLTANVQSVNSQTGAVVLTTTNVAEGTNLYYTDERVDDRVGSLLQAGTNITLNYDDTANTLTISATAGAGGITTVQEEGSNLTNRSTINFIGGGITAADNAGGGRTDVTLDATLNALAAYNTNGILTQTAADTFVGRTLTGTTDRISITNGNGVSGNPTVDIASTYAGQISIDTLGVVTTGTWEADTVAAIFGGTGQSSYAVGDLLSPNTTTTLSRVAAVATGSVLKSAGVSTLPVWGTLASTDLSDSSNIALLNATQTFSGTTNTFSNNIVIPSTPTLGTHAASKDYVDSIVATGVKTSVRAASTANGTLATAFENGDTLDGVTLVTGNRILLKNQTTQAENGIYTVNASGAPTRATDMDTAGEVDGKFVIVEDGTTLAGTIWLTVSEVTTLGTDAIVFTQINSATDIVAGAGLTKTGLTVDVGTANSGRIVVNADNIDLATTAVTPGSYGTSTAIPSITVDAYGRITAASNTNAQIPINVLDTDPGFTGWAETSGGTINFEGLNFVSYRGINIDVSASGSAIRIGHSATGASSLDTSAAQVIDTLTIDTYGHVTGVTTRDLTLADLGGAGDATIAYLESSTATTVDLDSGTSVKDRNGTNIAFTLPTNVDNFEVYRNGVLQNRTGTSTTRDYQVNTGTNEITFVVALTADEIVIFKKR